MLTLYTSPQLKTEGLSDEQRITHVFRKASKESTLQVLKCEIIYCYLLLPLFLFFFLTQVPGYPRLLWNAYGLDLLLPLPLSPK